ncbi:putative cytochrome P450 [Helianthus annuus]|nr:putative cytochrome P450 [Helianthus annuus]
MFLPYLFLLSLPVLSLLYILLKKKSKLNPPGPPGLPFIGNLHQLDLSSLHTSLWNLTKPYGPIVSLRFGFNSAVVISSASLAEEILKTQDLIFCSRPSFIGQRKLTYDGQDIAISPYNEHWREMRKIFTFHLFSPKRVQSFRHIREYEVSTAMKTIHDLALSSETINLSKMMKNLTTTIMMKVCFGKKYHCRDGLEIKKVLGLLNEVQAYLVDLYVSDIWPGLPFVGLVDRLTGKMNRHDKCFRDLDSFYQKLIDERLNTQKDKSYEEDEDDLIDILLQLVKDRMFSLTHDHIKAILMIHKDIQLTSWMDVGDVNAGTLNKSTLLGKKFSFVYNMC